MSGLLPTIIAAGFAVAASLVIMAFRGIVKEVPTDERAYRDPLTPALRLIWPLVRLFDYHLFSKVPAATQEHLTKQLIRSGIAFMMTPGEFLALRVTGALLATLFVLGGYLLLDAPVSIVMLLLAMLAGYWLPVSSLRDLRKKREQQVLRALPAYLDFINMALEAGLNLSGAISQIVEKAPRGPLHGEFARVQREIKAGQPRMVALKAMADRLDVREVHTLISAVAQAEKTGASVGDVLRIQADQRRVERFQRAEKKAMEAPVKLIFPLVAFIFPITFVVLGFPIVMKFIYEL